MGAIGESIAAYAQPLIDATDGSIEQMNNAMGLSQVCWNLALFPEGERDRAIDEMQATLDMGDAEFEALRRSVVLPMIRRHEEMFPRMHGRGAAGPGRGLAGPPRGMAGPSRGKTGLPAHSSAPAKKEKYPGTGRNEPCPCGSGKKYKRCCGR